MPEPFVQANTNGRLHPAKEPSLSPLNRGFLYGDAVYEVWRTYHGVVFAWEEHWSRLRASAKALYLELPFTPSEILSEIRKTVAAFQAACGFSGDVYIRLQITRGAGPIGLDIALADKPDFVILVQPCPVLSIEKAKTGMTLSLANDLRRNAKATLDPAWKTGNYLNNLLCLREARSRGADEVIILNLSGEVTEAAVSNIAFVRGGLVLTPPLDAGILGGITRALVLAKVAKDAGLVIQESSIKPSDFPSMGECMLLSTTKDIVPVGAIDSVKFRVAEDTVTARLKAAFAAHARAYADSHAELKVA